MDTRQYQELLEDVQIDVAEAERTAAEMRSIESYIQRKLDARGDNENHYTDLLNDVRRDIAGVDREMSELRGVESYLRRKLKGDRAGESFGGGRGGAGAPTAFESAAAADVVEFEPVDSSKSKPPLKKPMPLTKPASGEKSTSRPPEKPKPRPMPSGDPDAMQTVEFGPDGFPMT